MRLILSLLVSGLTFFVLDGAAKPLETSDLLQIRNVAILVGTFDPPTETHLAMAKSALAAGMDAVIVLPNSQISHKAPTPFSIRLRLWDVMARNEAKILVPIDGLFREIQENRSYSSPEFVNHLLAINPALKFFAIGGADVLRKRSSQWMMAMAFKPSGWLLQIRSKFEIRLPTHILGRPVTPLLKPDNEISATEVRRELKKRLDLYLHPETLRPKDCPRGLSFTVCSEIVQRGIYIGRDVDNAQTWNAIAVRSIKKAYTALSRRLGLYEKNKHWMVAYHLRAKPPENEIQISHRGRPTKFKVEGFLGAGMSAMAYKISYAGGFAVLKVPHEGSRFRNTMSRVTESALFVGSRSGINSPKVLDYDPDGAWAIYEWVEGARLDHLLSQKVSLNSRQMKSLQDLFRKVGALSRDAGLHLDFAPDNIVFKGDTAYLVDLGPTQEPMNLENLDENLERWKKIYSPECEDLLIEAAQ